MRKSAVLLCVLLVSACAHAPDTTQQVSAVYLYEVEFEFNGKPLTALRTGWCSVEIACPKPAAGVIQEPRKPHIPVSPFPQGQEVAYFNLTPPREGAGGTLVVRVRLSDRAQVMGAYVEKCKLVGCRLQSVLADEEQRPDIMLLRPRFPVEVVVPDGNEDAALAADNYFFLKRELRYRLLNEPDFAGESRKEARSFYEKPRPEGLNVKLLEPDRWVEFAIEFPEGAPPRSIRILGMDMQLNVTSF